MLLGVSMLVLLNSIGIEGAGTFGQYTGVFLCDGLCLVLVLRVVKWNLYSSSKHAQNEKQLAEFWDDYNKYELKEIINNEYGYEEFMNALIQEFSSENLLFATEYTQFRSSLGIGNSQPEIECIEFNTCLSDQGSLSYSSIGSTKSTTDLMSTNSKEFQKNKDKHTVADQDSSFDDAKSVFLDMVKLLYLKYIQSLEAPYEINISFENRNALAELIDDEYDSELKGLPSNATLDELQKIIIPILESILLEIIQLLNHSFRRFKKTDKWIEVCQILAQNTKKAGSMSSRAVQVIPNTENTSD